MLVNKLHKMLVGGNVFLHSGKLFPGNVFGDIAAVLAVLEVVVRLSVRTCSDNGDVAALHAGDGGHLSNTFG